MIVLDKRVRNHVERRADAEILVESDGVRSVGNRLRIIDIPNLLRGLNAQHIDLFSLPEHPVHPEMPLSEAGRVVSLRLEQRGDCQSSGLNESRAEPSQYTRLQLRPPRVAAGD